MTSPNDQPGSELKRTDKVAEKKKNDFKKDTHGTTRRLFTAKDAAVVSLQPGKKRLKGGVLGRKRRGSHSEWGGVE